LSERKVARRIIEELKREPISGKQGFSKLKYRISSEEGLRRILKDHEIIQYLAGDEMGLVPLLRGKEVRSASGIYTVAVMTRPWKCPKDSPCIYCPGGVDAGTPQSYIGNEPALMRGLQTGFDPYLQVRYRLDQYRTIGHNPSKVQLIVMGGTFPATEPDYQDWFVRRCLEAMNDYPNRPCPRQPSYTLQSAETRNSRGRVRCIGITMETRPDWAGSGSVDRMIELGATLVEMGVQCLDDRILMAVDRGCTVDDAVEATRTLRDSGLKVGYHMMPGLPDSSPQGDIDDLRRIFEDERFKPDYLKIYPTLVMEGTGLHKMWRMGTFRALSDEDAVELIARATPFFPRWVRVARIQRDVPAGIIVDGVRKSNLRELVDERAKALGIRCHCIRCREVGLAGIRQGKITALEPEMARESYAAGNGTEEFLTVEDKKRDLLVGFLRLRIPSEGARRKEVIGSAVIRELHVYGPQLPVGDREPNGYQHKGWGAMLLQRAEEIAREEYDLPRISVLPGVGVREYYRRRGFRKVRSSPFMVKVLV
jgi:elongator complex protein 3